MSKYFLAALGVAALLTGFVLWQGFFTDVSPEGPVVKPPQEIELRFDILEGDALNKLEIVGTEPTLPGETGKENPFLP